MEPPKPTTSNQLPHCNGVVQPCVCGSVTCTALTDLNKYVEEMASQPINESIDVPQDALFEYRLGTVYQNVRMKRLPFFDILEEIVKPVCLIEQVSQVNQEICIEFKLSEEQSSAIAQSIQLNYKNEVVDDVQVQMRFCQFETEVEQEDSYPEGLAITVNGKKQNIFVPNMKQKVRKRSYPINITSLIHTNPFTVNKVVVSCMLENQKYYAAMINLVRKVSILEVLERLEHECIQPSDHTQDLIKQSFLKDMGCSMITTMTVQLICPLGKRQIKYPCRATTCCHLQCFDAFSFLRMNEHCPKWKCPICNKDIEFDHLIIDDYFQQVLNSHKLGRCHRIQLHKDGSWSPLYKTAHAKKKRKIPEFTLSTENEKLSLHQEELNSNH